MDRLTTIKAAASAAAAALTAFWGWTGWYLRLAFSLG